MIRAELIGPEALVDLADEYDTRASRERVKELADQLSMTAHRLRVLAIDHDPPPAVDPESQMRAEYLRKRMWERGAIDGGKQSD
ncbi:hypothetical protein [Stakelama pacifica]|uniref:Uncharacterized protein n=2 Tax=Stakelama pacifica TaxID=517720 RepID=A0A4R6FJY2_9SPHN|nr:hypothetical protein [Stakelama pacifica]TDN81786.1 hypothetical protein EV664_107188 [Stakelama pacifica]